MTSLDRNQDFGRVPCTMGSVWLQGMAIEKAHRRSAAHGLGEGAITSFIPLGPSDLSRLIEQNRVLHTHALPVMENLYQQIADNHNMVTLADASGLILHSLGDDDFIEKADRVALKPGMLWSEENMGTNAIGTAIFDRLPTQVHGSEHYLRANRFLTSCAAPIFDARRNVIGVLDVAGDQSRVDRHTMALVKMSAQMIENQLFAVAFPDANMLHFSTRPECIGTLMHGVAAFTSGGRLLSVNRSGLGQLGMTLPALLTHTVGSLFGLSIAALHEHDRPRATGLLDLRLASGVRLYGRVAGGAYAHASSSAPPARAGVARSPATPAAPGLRALNTGDPQLAALIDKVNKVLGRNIPIMIMGETGTGKELLAQAIHNDSPRAAGPFVAVNCASIPETLIESELFGYEDGAFTGARKKGNAGKILQANGGTLFLDELGDMPLSLQARLLRVLQERMVTPLGSSRAIPVNVELICATNRNLRDMIARGAFREDLYYRLNGLVVRLPPLRDRTDLGTIVKRILATEPGDIPYTVHPELLNTFQLHGWPGNFRQLSSLLRTAIVMVDADHEIGLRHMPDDFLEDLVRMRGADAGADNLIGTSARLDEVGHALIRKSLAVHGGNVSATAKALGISRNTIYRKTGALQKTPLPGLQGSGL